MIPIELALACAAILTTWAAYAAWRLAFRRLWASGLLVGTISVVVWLALIAWGARG